MEGLVGISDPSPRWATHFSSHHCLDTRTLHVTHTPAPQSLTRADWVIPTNHALQEFSSFTIKINDSCSLKNELFYCCWLNNMPKIHGLQYFLPINHFMNYSEIFVLHCLWHWLFGVREVDKHPLNIFSLSRDSDWEMREWCGLLAVGVVGNTLKFKKNKQKEN